MSPAEFDWFEYIVFCLMLLLSTMIGVFFCFSKGGQHTVSEYYHGDKQMSLFPVTMSLIASFISGVTLLGVPSEIYNHGSQIIFANLAELILFCVNVTLYQPVFYKLQMISLYEYLEMRFDRRVRIMASILFVVDWILYMSIVMYGPVLAFNQVSGLSLHVVSPLVCLVCIFYTTVGGLKAVVWADALQATVMLGAIVVVIITGLSHVGGFANVMSVARKGGRLDAFDLNPDPTERLTLWSSIIGITFMWSSDIVSPMSIQRYLSLPTLQTARKASFCLLVGVCTFYLLSLLMGLIIYTHYQLCDPLSAKMIKRSDQILPHFVLDVAGHLKGLPGLFIAGIVCAALSTLSTGMNTMSGTIYSDFLKPIIGEKSERTASNIMKILSALIGITCTGLVSVVDKLGNIIDMGAAVAGVTGGSIFAVFTMGVLMPKVNSQGALYGGILSSLVLIWTLIGHEIAPKCLSKKILSVEGCSNFNISATLYNETCQEMSTAFKTGFPLYKISHFYYGLMGFVLCIVIGVAISYWTGFNDPTTIKPQLLSPIIRGHETKKESSHYVPVTLKTMNEKSST